MEKSMHELITELCEKHIDKRKCMYESLNYQLILKRMRSKAFEILLKKKHITECVSELEGNTDSICHLLAWQYTLRNEYHQDDKAETLSCFIEHLKNNQILNDSVAQNVILFLLHLRGSCPETEDTKLKYDILDKVILKHKNCMDSSALPYDIYHEQKFHFPKTKSKPNSKQLKQFKTKQFTTEPALNLSLIKSQIKTNDKVLSYSTNYKFTLSSMPQIKAKESKVEAVCDEGYESPHKEFDENIWEVVSKMPVNEHRTWESLDNIDPKKEMPFACESGPKTLHFLQKIFDANVCELIDNQENFVPERILPNIEFIKNVKYMLVGMISDIFLTNDNDEFYLKEGICVEGILSEALNSYCSDLLYCGSCYRALKKLCSADSHKYNEINGYVFKELCESVNRYLAYYRVAALSCPDSSSLLILHSHMRPLYHQIGALFHLCSPKNNQILTGAELLDYIYQEITKAVDEKVILVLYSVFYPCCQIYFSRFLQRWLFEGVLIDPFEEFIVKSEPNYIKSRARIYWTRSFSLRHNAIPEFLSDLKIDILQCGKAMNLLKLCNPDASLYTHIMSRSLPLISCCLTPDQSNRLKQEIDCYYVEMASLCGPRISLYHKMRDQYGMEENTAFLSLVEKKRALTFKELELKKQQEMDEKAKLKRKIFEEMKEQIRISAEHKKKVKEDELKEELLIAEQNAQIEELRSKLVKEESRVIIKYYNNLIEAVDKRKISFELRKQKLLDSLKSSDLEFFSKTENSKLSLDNSVITLEEQDIKSESKDDDNNIKEIEEIELPIEEKSLTTKSENYNLNVDSKATILEKQDITTGSKDDENNMKKIELPIEEKCPFKAPSDLVNLDVENANIKKPIEISASEQLYNQRNETFLAAQRNRAKVLNLEFNTKIIEPNIKPKYLTRDTSSLTEAQRNKLKVMSSEFDVYYQQKVVENNGNIIEKPSIILPNEVNDNNDVLKVTSNLASPGHEDVMNVNHRKKILKLPKQAELLTIYEREKVFNDVTPMSVDSTPNTECSAVELPTPLSAKLSLNTDICFDSASLPDSALLTANSCLTDDGFRFPTSEPSKFSYESSPSIFTKRIFSITQNIPQSIRPMRVSKMDVGEIKNGNLKSLLYQSVYIPLEAQTKLVNSEIVKYFVNEQHFFSHLQSLRCYYFLLDGEFGRRITEDLFTKLYECKSPADLLSCRSLQLIIDRALHASSRIQENGNRLSFIVRNIPISFDYSSAEVFECLSLSYKINWPLNVLLPYDTIEKYDLIFKYLLKLHHMSWVLQKVFQELKNSQKEYGIDETLLMSSPQYHKIQLYRHVMMHFIQTLQNYTASEVLQTSWEEFENNLKTVTTLDQLYTIHVLYIKTILFRCLLNRKCESIMKVIREIFVVILKFYNYLRSRSWNLKENDIYYTHPNFKKLEYIFNKFEEFAIFVFRVGNKMARVGYQPHLIQMLDMLNMNDYYINKQNS